MPASKLDNFTKTTQERVNYNNDTSSFHLLLVSTESTLLYTYYTAISVQVLYSTPDQSKSGSACHMTRSANHRRLSVVI